jgi:hypothetical protein
MTENTSEPMQPSRLEKKKNIFSESETGARSLESCMCVGAKLQPLGQRERYHNEWVPVLQLLLAS